LSDANIECLSVDISLDLPQILGRQRLDCNPWKNKANFYFRPLSEEGIISENDFKTFQNNKIERTKKLLNIYFGASDDISRDLLAEKYRNDINYSRYKGDYVSVNSRLGSNQEEQLSPEFNKLVYISEKRAFEIQQVDYKDRFSVFNSVENSRSGHERSEEISRFLRYINDSSIPFSERLKNLCETPNFSDLEKRTIVSQASSVLFERYYCTLGPSRCKACGYKYHDLSGELELKKTSLDPIKEEIYNTFLLGGKYKKYDIKEYLSGLYKKYKYGATPKATDLEKYFIVKPVLIRSDSGKRESGYWILNKK